MPLNPIGRWSAVLVAVVAAAPLAAGPAAAAYAYPGAYYSGPGATTTTTTTVTRTYPENTLRSSAASVAVPVHPTPGAGATTPVHAVFLRAAPSTEAPVIGVLRPGMPLHILASANYGWIRVSTPEGLGWTYGSYLAPG
ncbi:MAG TPA: SH3 domain-containing protein [Stellaceae bacterium]|nr:SH3 domain-containing protein [Stellaceae bacterium]